MPTSDSLPLFQRFLGENLGVPNQLINTIISFYQTEQLSRGDFFLKKHERCQQLCFITSGYLRFFSYAGEKSITHWIFGKGQLVTDAASFFLGEPAKWNIQALSDTTVYTISLEQYQRLRTEISAWDNYEKLLLVKLLSALENRVYAFTSMSAEERYQYLFESDSAMFNELPLHYIASMLGITPETLSRIRRKSAQ